MTTQLILKVLLLTFLISTMMGAGLGLTAQLLIAPMRDARLVLTSMALSFVVAPGLALLLTRLIPLQPAHATGLLLLGCSAGAPFLPKLVEVAGADVASSVALMTLLTVATTLFLPLALPWLVPGLEASAWDIARPLLALILLPLGVGMLLRRQAAEWAARWQPRLSRIASLSGLLMLSLLVVRDLAAMRDALGTGAAGSVAIFTAVIFLLGYFAGGPTRRGRGLLGITSGSRNVGAALVPAAQAATDPRIMTMLVTGTLVMILILIAACAWLRYRLPIEVPSHDIA
jgi:bile acid:Na+ symporter, BASS family